MLGKQSPEDIKKVIDKVGVAGIEEWATEMGNMSVAERKELFEVLTKNLDAERLARFYGGMSDSVRREYVDTINKLDDKKLNEKFVEAVQREALEKAEVPPGLTPDQEKLYLDLLQIALDLVGIVEPTPFADLTNTAISVARGDWLGAGLSLAGVFPYIGDMAKLGKLGRWSETVTEVIDLAANNKAFAKTFKPILTKIDDAIDSIPARMLAELSARDRGVLQFISRKFDALLNGRTVPTGTPGDPPGGKPTKITGDPQEREGLRLENKSADILAKAGYKVFRNPGKRPDNDKEPDYLIEGVYADCYAPHTPKIKNVRTKIWEKTAQAELIIVNLSRSDFTVADIENILHMRPIEALKELKVITKSGEIIDVFPF